VISFQAVNREIAENSHQPTRARERAMKRFTSAGHAQRFLSAFSGISPHFRTRRHPAPRPGIPARDDQPLQYLERSHQADHRSLNHRQDPAAPSSTTH
jgi:hypothetical protein